MNKENETKPARELTEKLLAMAAVCAANLPKGHFRTAHEDIVEYLQEQLCIEVGNEQ